MKAAFALGLIASFASLVAASPAADAATQLEAREPIICIGCVNQGNCNQQSEPSGCDSSNGNGCTKWCFVGGVINCICCERPDTGAEWTCPEA